MKIPMNNNASKTRPNVKKPNPESPLSAREQAPTGTLKPASGKVGALEGLPTGGGVGGSVEVDTGGDNK